MAPVRTHYDNLMVSRSAPQEVIRAAYKTLTQKYHPDRNPNNPDSGRIMALINTSYEVLSNPEKRRQHDAWIKVQEQGAFSSSETQEPQAHQPEESNDRDFVPPLAGTFSYEDLPASAREKLQKRMSGENKEQLLIKNGSVMGNYLWSIAILGWFAYLFFDAGKYKWDQDSILWMSGLTGAAAILLSINLSMIMRCHLSPLRNTLIASPLYIIKTEFSKVHYWPIWTLTNINATHNYRNGIYNGTTVSMTFNKSKETFSIRPEAMYKTLASRLSTYDKAFRSAVANGNVDYFTIHDDFADCHSLPERKGKKRFFGIATACYAGTFIVSSLIFVIAALYNGQMQLKPEAAVRANERSVPYVREHKTQPVVAVKSSYVRSKTAPNGVPWPTVSGYISKYKQFNKGGYSNVTIDNTRNDSDVFVKLVDISGPEAFPVRTFFITKYGKFTLSDIKIGVYDIRYRDLETGELARSEQFQVEERKTHNGVEYSTMTMTLYKVRNGNMQTYSIPESDF